MAQAYHWTPDQIFKLTMPQIIMLNAAAEVNRKRLDKRANMNRQNGTASVEDVVNTAPVWNGKRVDQMTTSDYLLYHKSAGRD